jgi:exopolysaccharide biosynthesis WecB/TagA/CpsF family protein
MHQRLPFLGLDFDPLSVEATAAAMAWRARKLAPFAYVTTPNVDHMIRLERAPHLRAAYQRAWLNVSDSRILEAFAEASYLTLPAAPGSDIVACLFTQHIKPHERVVVIGGSQVMADALRARYGLRDLRWFDAPMGLREDAAARASCVAFIRENPAPFVFLAVGSPQQEMIALEAMLSGQCAGVAICCGAALEFLSGQTSRAPGWMRERRLEWLHRLASEPSRLWRRYLLDGPRIFMVWHRWRSQPLSPFTPANDMAVSPQLGEHDARDRATLPLLGPGDRRDVSSAA